MTVYGFLMLLIFLSCEKGALNQNTNGQLAFFTMDDADFKDDRFYFIEGGDGHFDFDEHLLVPEYEVLILPCIRPFNPAVTSKFQLSEQRRAIIYRYARYS